jgi:hypothetical protein
VLLSDLDRWDGLAAAASGGPWVAIYYDARVAECPGWDVDCNAPDVLSVATAHHGYGGPGEAEANARFMAEARTAVPALCAKLREVHAERGRLRRDLEVAKGVESNLRKRLHAVTGK